MDKLIKQLKAYECMNEQEISDKQVMEECIASYNNILLRENKLTHFIAMGFVLNETFDKVLMVYHNIFKEWTIPGGHTDGDADLFRVATKEVSEETGLKNLKVIDENIFSIDILPAVGHIRKKKYVSTHTHLGITYLFVANEKEALKIQPDENSKVGWIPLSEVTTAASEEHMQKIYAKMIEKLKGRI